MKKKTNVSKLLAISLVFVLAVAVVFPASVFASADNPGETASDAAPAAYTVSYYNNGALYHEETVAAGSSITAPVAEPEAPEGMRFSGWFEENAIAPYVFDGSAVNDAVTLYAAFEAVPAESIASAESENPAETDAPTETNGPTEPAESPEAAEPTDPTTPNEETVPAEPSEPSESTGSVESTEPAADIVVPENAAPVTTATAVLANNLRSFLRSTTATVTFMVDGEVYDRATVERDTLVSLPTPTSSVSNDPFLGWYAEGESVPFSKSRLVEGDITLTAKFTTHVLVTYLDTDGTELEVFEVEQGQPAPTATKSPALSLGEQFLYWVQAGEGTEYDYSTSTLTQSITLAPQVTNRALAIFVTQGSEVEPQTGAAGFKAEKPQADPTRDGYVFDGWVTAENGDEAFNFEEAAIHETVFIYAKWKAGNANYTVNLWVEKADTTASGDPLSDRSGYELQYTTTQTGTTDDTITVDAMQARSLANKAPGDARNLLVYSTYQTSEEKTLSPNGDTVLNVYFTRTEFTFTFDVSAYADGAIYTGANCDVLQGQKYELTVKVGQDISTSWPTKVVLSDDVYFVNWGNYYGLAGQIVSYGYISNSFSNKNASSSTGKISSYQNNVTPPVQYAMRLVPTTTTNPYTATRYYYVELSEAEKAEYLENGALSTGEDVRTWSKGNGNYAGLRYYKYAQENVLEHQNGWNPAGWPGRDIAGYETIGMASSNLTCKTTYFQQVIDHGANGLGSRNNYSIYYYMPAKTYTLTLVTGAAATVDNAAGFGLEQGNGSYTAGLSYGANVDLPGTADITRANYVFDGWYLDEYYMEEYTPGTMPAKDLTLYAKYSGTEVAVTYKADMQTIWTTIKDGVTYAHGEKLNEHDLSGTVFEGVKKGDVVPGYGTFDGWYYEVGEGTKAAVEFPLGLTLERGQYDLIAKLIPATYNVTFQGDEGGSSFVTYNMQTAKSGANNTLARSGNPTYTPPAREGYTFKGWTTTEGGTFPNFTAATRVLEDMTVYAVWEIVPVTVSYNGNEGTTTPDVLEQTVSYGQSLEVAGLALPWTEAVSREGHTFLGWFTEAEGGAEFTASTSLKEDITVYAHWAKEGTVPVPPVPPVPPTPTDPPAVNPDPVDPVTSLILTPIVAAPAGAPALVPGAVVPALYAPAQNVATGETPAADTPTTVGGDNTPLGGLAETGSWSLLSLMMAVAGALISMLMLVTVFTRRKEETEAEDGYETRTVWRKNTFLKVAAIVLGLLAGVLFLALDDLSLSMVFLNKWTLWVAVPFILHLAVVVAHFFRRKKTDEEALEEAN